MGLSTSDIEIAYIFLFAHECFVFKMKLHFNAIGIFEGIGPPPFEDQVEEK